MPGGCPEPSKHGTDQLFRYMMSTLVLSLLLLGASCAEWFRYHY